MNSGTKKIITVSLPADLVDMIESLGRWHNRSRMITEAVEEYIRVHDPSLYKLLEVRRNA